MNIDSPNIIENITMPFYWGITGTRTGVAEFTFAGTDNDCYKYLESIFTCRAVGSTIGGGDDGKIDNDGGSALITEGGHGRLDGDVVFFTGTLTSTNLSTNTPYFVKVKDIDSYYLCTTLVNLVAATKIAYGADGVGVKVENLKYGYLNSITQTGGTCTATVVSSEDLAANDHTFRISTVLKADRFVKEIRIGAVEVVADASNPQGIWYNDTKQHNYLLPVDLSLKTAATDAGALLTVRVYADATVMNTDNWDMDTNKELVSKRPDLARWIPQGADFTVRVTGSAGATKAAGLQIRTTHIPIARLLNT